MIRKILMASLPLMVALAAPAFAGPTYTFSLDSSASGPQGVGGTVTLSQDGKAVDVSVVLSSGYGMVNTGGPHSFFAFDLVSNAGLQIAFATPTDGKGTNGTISLDTTGGTEPGYGSYNTIFDYSGGKGASHGYFGSPTTLDFKLSYSGAMPLDTTDFIANASNVYFAADLVNSNGKTGVVVANTRTPADAPVPEPAGIAILGAGLAAMGLLRRCALGGKSADPV